MNRFRVKASGELLRRMLNIPDDLILQDVQYDVERNMVIINVATESDEYGVTQEGQQCLELSFAAEKFSSVPEYDYEEYA